MTQLERWETPDQIDAAMRRFAAQLPGWHPPAAHGTVLVSDHDPEPSFPVVNVGAHGLPAVVMGLVTGRTSGTGTYELSADDLARAVELLAPAEAARMYRHQNIASWRAMLRRMPVEQGARVFTVFIDDLADEVSGPYDEALRRQIAAGERAPQLA